jgi:hypothetical protein
MYLESMNLSGISSSGTTVSATIATGGTFYVPQRYTGASFLIAGASDPALNASCTNLAFNISGGFTCTISGLSGTHTSASATVSLGNNGFILWPMAETLDVQDYTTNPISVDGTFTLEPNIIPFVSGDTIEQTHNQASSYSAISANLGVNNPYTNMGGADFGFSGMGIQGSNGSGYCLSCPSLGDLSTIIRDPCIREAVAICGQ